MSVDGKWIGNTVARDGIKGGFLGFFWLRDFFGFGIFLAFFFRCWALANASTG